MATKIDEFKRRLDEVRNAIIDVSVAAKDAPPDVQCRIVELLDDEVERLFLAEQWIDLIQEVTEMIANIKQNDQIP